MTRREMRLPVPAPRAQENYFPPIKLYWPDIIYRRADIILANRTKPLQIENGKGQIVQKKIADFLVQFLNPVCIYAIRNANHVLGPPVFLALRSLRIFWARVLDQKLVDIAFMQTDFAETCKRCARFS